jgi:hypothetical protein
VKGLLPFGVILFLVIVKFIVIKNSAHVSINLYAVISRKPDVFYGVMTVTFGVFLFLLAKVEF